MSVQLQVPTPARFKYDSKHEGQFFLTTETSPGAKRYWCLQQDGPDLEWIEYSTFVSGVRLRDSVDDFELWNQYLKEQKREFERALGRPIHRPAEASCACDAIVEMPRGIATVCFAKNMWKFSPAPHCGLMTHEGPAGFPLPRHPFPTVQELAYVVTAAAKAQRLELI